MSKVRCIYCHELVHFATNFLLKKSLGGVASEALASQLELDFTLIACMVSSMMGSVWYHDSRASFHMARDKELFSHLVEKDLQMHIKMGDNGRYSATRLGTITFQREQGSPLTLRDVMYVHGLKENIVLITMLEDRSYDVVFSKGMTFLQHIAMG